MARLYPCEVRGPVIAPRQSKSATRVGAPAFAGAQSSDLCLLVVGRRNPEPGDHLAKLLTGGDVGDADFAELVEVEQRQALGEELAVDDALAEPGDDAEADAASEFVERGADATKVVRLDVLQAVPQHHPVDALARLFGAG